LFVRGAGHLAAAVDNAVAMVGMRAATDYGIEVATTMAVELSDRDWSVVSGGAYGIDAASHRGALATGGTTIAVLACGVDVTYPRGHDGLFAAICDNGLIVSELPPGSAPHRMRFLDRNRLIAALGAGTVVVEAAARSGARRTALEARDLGRALMIVPGPVHAESSVGCHRLLRDVPTSVLVTGAHDSAANRRERRQLGVDIKSFEPALKLGLQLRVLQRLGLQVGKHRGRPVLADELAKLNVRRLGQP